MWWRLKCKSLFLLIILIPLSGIAQNNKVTINIENQCGNNIGIFLQSSPNTNKPKCKNIGNPYQFTASGQTYSYKVPSGCKALFVVMYNSNPKKKTTCNFTTKNNISWTLTKMQGEKCSINPNTICVN